MTATPVLAARSQPVIPREHRDGISAVVCTRDRVALLARALRSLLAQSEPPAEVVVVDNAPDGGAVRRLVESEFPMVRYVAEAVPGLNHARNRALQTATQPVVAFLDDDAVADAQWSATLLRGFMADDRLAACTGRVEALSLEHEGQRIVEANGGYARGLRSVALPEDARGRLHGLPAPLIAWAVSFGSGCSLAVRRDAALAVGGFDPVFGGRDLPGGDDHDMLWRLLAAGYRIKYEAAALAWHEHRPAAEAAYDQILGHQRGLVAFLTKALRFGSGRQRVGVFAFLIWRLLKPGVRLLRHAIGQDPLPLRVIWRMWWQCWQGLVAGSRTSL